jgi:hypothetical protein
MPVSELEKYAENMIRTPNMLNKTPVEMLSNYCFSRALELVVLTLILGVSVKLKRLKDINYRSF